jgi:ParB-like chromosome segregation protein Spo0J
VVHQFGEPSPQSKELFMQNEMYGDIEVVFGPQMLTTTDIRPDADGIREVDKESEKYLGIKAAIAEANEKGMVFEAITVRPQLIEGEFFYEIINGLHRWTAHMDLGIELISAAVNKASDKEAKVAQVVLNLHREDTKPSAFAKGLKQYMDLQDEGITMAELSKVFSASSQFIKGRLSLLKIESERVLELIDASDICIQNAYAMTKLPVDEQESWADRAITELAGVFVPAVTARCSEIRKANASGKNVAEAVFKPTKHLLRMKDVEALLADGEAIEAIADMAGGNVQNAVILALQTCIHADPASVEAQKGQWEERQEAASKKKEATSQASISKERQKLMDKVAALDAKAADMPDDDDGVAEA